MILLLGFEEVKIVDCKLLKKAYECGDEKAFSKVLNEEIDRQNTRRELKWYIDSHIKKDYVASNEKEESDGIKIDTSGKMINRNYKKYRDAMERASTKSPIDRFIDSNIKEEVIKLDRSPTMTWGEAAKVTGIDESLLKSFVEKHPMYCRAIALRNGNEVYSRAICDYAGQLRFELGLPSRLMLKV